ncbi:Protein TOXD [Escovopsis weberi]|uniref:Protein TOXD n=1 Tax=Escovopsis weberi TaxID=150374 RepID=A0A0M9VRY3_ESCWE|nr:Protein TOXD [Escovopsis weberi]
MKEAVVNPDTTVSIQEVPKPIPGPGEVLVSVAVFGTNPKDWKYPAWRKTSYNTGDDVAGVVAAVGPGVFEFREGDRVAGYHNYKLGHGTFAELAIVPAYACVRIPDSTSFEEAATIPLAALTAAVGLFKTLALPSPWQLPDPDPEQAHPAPPITTRTPLVIYGASTAVGAFAIKLARHARIHPLIAVGSPASRFVADEYLDPALGDALVDYTEHDSPAALAAAVRDALVRGGAEFGRAYHALDCVGEKGSFEDVLAAALGGGDGGGPAIETAKRPLVASVLQPQKDSVNGVDAVMTFVGWCHADGWSGRAFASIWLGVMARGLVEGWFKPHPHEVLPGGLQGLEGGLKRLRDGKVRATKLVGRVCETPGI